MFEFLKLCDNFNIYERACDCERCLGFPGDVIIFRTFCEAAFKSIAQFELPGKKLQGKLITFIDDYEFAEVLGNKYDFQDIQTVNHIREKGNNYAHGEQVADISGDLRVRMFKCIYKLAACICYVRTGKKPERLTNNDVKTIIARNSHCGNMELIDKLIKENKEIYKEKDKALQEVNRLRADNETIRKQSAKDVRIAREEVKEARKETEKALEQLNAEKFKNVDEEKYRQFEKKCEKQENIINNMSADMQLLNERLAYAEKNNDKEKVIRLKGKINSLSSEISILKKENENLNNQIDKLAEQSCDRSAYEELKGKYEKTLKELVEKENKYAAVQKNDEARVRDLEDSERPVNLLQMHWKKYYEKKKLTEELRSSFQKQLEQVNELSPYICGHCGKKLLLSKKLTGWYCPDWKEEKEKFLKSSFRRLSYEEKLVVIEPLEKLKKEINDSESELMAWCKKNMPAADPQCPIKLSPTVLQQVQKKNDKEIDFKEYPFSLSSEQPYSVVFQSVCVPSEIFEKKENLNIYSHAKFKVCYDQRLTENRNDITKENRTVYSLVLRLLNRGFVLKTYRKIEDELRRVFDDGSYGNLEYLTEYIEYENPVMHCVSLEEQHFAKTYFPEVFGKSWASFVDSHPVMDQLLPHDYELYVNCCVDFVLNGYMHDEHPVVVELDGREHRNSMFYDRNRRMTLRDNGFHIVSYKNSDFQSYNEQIADELKGFFQKPEHFTDIDICNRFLVACKLQHQFTVAIAKALELGFVPAETCFRAHVSTSMFTRSEIDFILKTAIAELEELIFKFGEIYGIDINCNLTDDSACAVDIYVGDGAPDLSGITIRDNFFVYDYLCPLEPFSYDIQLKENITKEVLQFFNKYIFGFDDFRPGQLEAIGRLLHKEDSIILLPTGSGKSVIYQLASYIVPGMIVVISPLKSLIRDQILNLQYNHGINNAVGIISNSGSDAAEDRKKDILHMKCNATSLLYISPERLQMPGFRDDIKNMLQHNNVFCVAIDEAHCLSEWGHDFRPAYLVTGKNSRALFTGNAAEPVIIALTGTASTKIRDDMCRLLKIEDEDAVIYPDSFEREELQFSVKSCDSSEKIKILKNVLQEEMPHRFGIGFTDFVRLNEDKTYSGVVFTPVTRKGHGMLSDQYAAYEVASELKSIKNLKVASYYSRVPEGWDAATWEANINENANIFRENKINLLVATKAFGMGVDKGNIRFTIHDGMPQSIESFYQEAGRAGRDRNTSYCMILFSDSNPELNEMLLNPLLPLEELRSKCFNNKIEDDVEKQLFFHMAGFRGVEKDCKTVLKLFDYLLHPYGAWPFDEEEQKDNGKLIAHAIVRLMYLGIISDYQYDYSKKHFNIKMGSIRTDDVIDSYLSYIKTYDSAAVELQKQEIEKIKGDSWHIIKEIIKKMIRYSYSQIESGRRRQLIAIYEIMVDVAGKPPEIQDAIIKEKVNSYFALPHKRNIIHEIVKSGEIRLDLAISMFDIAQGKTVFDEKEVRRAKLTAGQAMHELESVSMRPDLILVKVLAQIVAGDYIPVGIANELTAVAEFSTVRYGLPKEDVENILNIVYNLAVAVNTELFNVIMDIMSEYQNVSHSAFIGRLMKSEKVTDVNRDYLAMVYYTESIKHMI